MFFALLFIVEQTMAQELCDSCCLKYMQGAVRYLASDSLEGRASGSKGESLAADFIAASFSANKRCKVIRQPFIITIDSISLNSQNILCFVNNGATNTVLIMAHYDHLGWGGPLSKSKGIVAVHNGADDNASGVALMLNLARTLSHSKSKCNYLFVAYSGHELGLFGSRYFSEHIPSKFKQIAFTLNLDMVGRMDADCSLYFDCTPGQEINAEDSTIANIGLKIEKSTSERLLILDSKWFALKNIPGITLTTGLHADYHKISDDFEYINFIGMLKIEKFILHHLHQLNYF